MSQITLPLDIKSLEVVSQCIDTEGNIVFEVKSKNDHSTCHKCGKPATKQNGRAPIRRIRHLTIFDQPVYLEIVPVRYICEHCDDHLMTTEQYDWTYTDMHDAFVYAAIEVFGPQANVIDRYHVARLYRKPLDKLRIKEMKRLKSELDSDEYAKLEGMMWIVRKQHECLSDADKSKLELLYKYSDKLKKAHS